MLQVLVVSKPFTSPWRDSSKNLARELVRACQEVRFRVMVPDSSNVPSESYIAEPIYASTGRFEPGLAQNFRVFKRLLKPAQAHLYHFFFAPNKRSAQAARLALAVRRHTVPAVQTLCSLPPEHVLLKPNMFADVVVALSAYAQQRLLAEGVRNVERIAPCVRPAAPISPQRRQNLRTLLGLKGRPVVLFAGDLEPARGAVEFVDAVVDLRRTFPEVNVIMATRAKTPRSLEHQALLRQRIARLGLSSCVRLLGETPHMRAILAASDVQVMVAASLEKKMDYPLVLLEGLALGTPIVVTDTAPLRELLDNAPAQAGRCVPFADPHALCQAIAELCPQQTIDPKARLAARELAAHFSPKRMAAEYFELYQRLLQS